MEIWKDIEGFDGIYQVSTFGRVRNTKTNRYLTVRKNKYGYMIVQPYKNNSPHTFRVHRLVAKAFIDNPEQKPYINHKDNNRSNNCVQNLEWCTAEENIRWAVKQGRHNTQHLRGSDEYEAGYTKGYQAGYAKGIRKAQKIERESEE